MLKIKHKHSITLSIALSVIFFIVCGVCAVLMPWITNLLIDARRAVSYDEITNTGRIVVLVLAYLVLLTAVTANFLLLNLLLRVKKGEVFTEKSVALIRGVAWCCFFISGVFCILGFYFHIVFILAFVSLFLGLCLRIVKNAFEEATEIKSENDLTV